MPNFQGIKYWGPSEFMGSLNHSSFQEMGRGAGGEIVETLEVNGLFKALSLGCRSIVVKTVQGVG